MAEVLKNGDGSISGQTVSSSDAPDDGAGQHGEAAPSSPARSESQERSLQILKEIQARGFGGAKLTEADWRRMHEHSKWGNALPSGREPEENKQAQPDDVRPADSTRDEIQRQHEPINSEQHDYLIARCKVNGVSPQWAEATAAVAQGLQLPEAEARTFADRVAKHFQGGQIGDTFRKLTAEEAETLEAEAVRLCGGRERMEQYSRGAREYLARFPEIYSRLEKHGAFNSSLALDVRLVMSLHNRNEHMKARGK